MPEGQCHDMAHAQVTQPGAGVCGEAQAGADASRRK